jgi:hypothetical protein
MFTYLAAKLIKNRRPEYACLIVRANKINAVDEKKFWGQNCYCWRKENWGQIA